jgi:hypothetical protein
VHGFLVRLCRCRVDFFGGNHHALRAIHPHSATFGGTHGLAAGEHQCDDQQAGNPIHHGLLLVRTFSLLLPLALRFLRLRVVKFLIKLDFRLVSAGVDKAVGSCGARFISCQ